ncbi:hypothetical protein L484_024750 [Morus notabilis]|uniref:Reverse transcriptase/retrotransposon-derived protein RNase H-like domain-containing protein n=1 Tax=Morus notabilis TaxID=981085 RepID=W9RD11_9ROSA|nr:hypothetical protein L484_024750 [Morus notabilis]
MNNFSSSFTTLLKKGAKFRWMEHHQKLFEKAKKMVINLTTMQAPEPGKPLRIYIVATESTIGALLALEGSMEKEHPVYCLSRQLYGPELRYSHPKKMRDKLSVVPSFDLGEWEVKIPPILGGLEGWEVKILPTLGNRRLTRSLNYELEIAGINVWVITPAPNSRSHVKKSTTNSANMKQSKGSASFAQHRHKHGRDIIENFQQTHYCEGHGWASEEDEAESLEMERRYNLATQASTETYEGSTSAASTQDGDSGKGSRTATRI